jgi:hypothetical protein
MYEKKKTTQFQITFLIYTEKKTYKKISSGIFVIAFAKENL